MQLLEKISQEATLRQVAIRSPFSGKDHRKIPLCVAEEVTTTYVASGWLAVQRFFWNID